MVAGPDGRNGHAALVARRKRIIFQSDREGTQGEIHVKDVDQTAEP